MSGQSRKSAPQPAGKFTGSDAVISCLKHQGVEVIFGMIGGQIMPVYDALYKDPDLKHIVVGHEQGAAHMAEGYARATGRPAVVFSTSGPGATNLVTGLADAFMDSTPMVAITGQVSSSLIGNDAFQEADMRGITMPITKHNYQVTRAEDLPAVLAEAFYVALSGRPGPVLIDLPKDVATAPCSRTVASPEAPVGYQPPYRGHPLQIERALRAIQKAQHPVILAGGGIIHAEASTELRQFAELINAPVSTTLMAMGAFPKSHRLSLGMPGMHGTGYANLAIFNSDLVIVAGARLDDRVTGQIDRFCPKARMIHIDVDASEIGKNLECHIPIVGDAKPVLKSLIKGALAWGDERPDLSAWHAQVKEWKETYPMSYPDGGDMIMPQAAVEELGRVLDDNAIVVTGVGQHQMFAAQFYPFEKPRTFITSGGLGTMGFGLPAAIGAKVARPDVPVVCVDGDGSFLMTIQELATAVRYRVPVVVMILNNSFLGMVAQWQRMFFDNRLSNSDTAPPPYDKVAQAFGALGRRVEKPAELRPSLEWALAESQKQMLPVVLDVMVYPEAKVLPMVPPGGCNAEFIPCEK